MNMNAELAMAWRIIDQTEANLFLTGKAGTGKTTFLKELRKQSVKRMVVLASTGIAAINAGGSTIHSFFQLPLSPYLPCTTYDRKGRKYFNFSKVKRDIIRTMDLLVIDEISMVRADLLDAVDSVMRRYREHDKPFGGAQLLMIGDLQQLAPVVKEDEWAMLSSVYDTPYFFSSKALNKAEYLTVELKTVYRQQDASFISLLNQIRENKATDETLAALNKRYIPDFKPSKDSDYIRLTTHNYPAQVINERELDSLPTKEYVFKAKVEGNFPETSYPAEERLVLKRGAQVMFIKNDPERRFFNGMIGEVVDVDDDNIIVKDKSGGNSFKLDIMEWTNSKYTLNKVSKEIVESVEGVFRQYPLRLAWAITIHKSQGLTFEHAIIDVSRSFAHGQTYVALSRCKTLDGLVLSAPLQRSAIISDSVLDGYINEIKTKEPTETVITALHQAYVVKTLDGLFDFTPVQAAFALLLRTLDEHFYRRYPKVLAEYKNVSVAFAPLAEVARKFKLQYTRMLSENPDVSADALQERIHKASAYFAKQTEPFILLCAKTKVDTENKTVRAQFDERYSVFKEECNLKLRLLQYEANPTTTFSTGDYMRMKAKILLGTADREDTPQRTRKPKPKKEQKMPTKQVSYEMFMRGMTVAQIAKERNLVAGTVLGHLVGYVKEGKLDYKKILSEEHFSEVQTFIRNHPNVQTVTEIKQNINPDITYDEVRFVLSCLN